MNCPGVCIALVSCLGRCAPSHSLSPAHAHTQTHTSAHIQPYVLPMYARQCDTSVGVSTEVLVSATVGCHTADGDRGPGCTCVWRACVRADVGDVHFRMPVTCSFACILERRGGRGRERKRAREREKERKREGGECQREIPVSGAIRWRQPQGVSRYPRQPV